MPPVSASRQFEVLDRVLALAEERGFIALTKASEIIGVPVEQLRTLLNPLLHLEYLDRHGEPIDQSRAFELDEDDVLEVNEHWLRDLKNAPPTGPEALRLYIAATVYQGTGAARNVALDSALAKLRQAVAIDMVVPTDRPTCHGVAETAYRQHRSLRFRYVRFKDNVATDREVLPWDLYGEWGHWFVSGPEVGDDVVKNWRIDRMSEASVGTVEFEPPTDLPERDFFDLSSINRRVTMRVPADRMAALPQPYRVVSSADDGSGYVRAEIEIAGDRHLDHLLVSLGPDGEVVEPPEYQDRRVAYAEKLLTALRSAAL